MITLGEFEKLCNTYRALLAVYPNTVAQEIGTFFKIVRDT